MLVLATGMGPISRLSLPMETALSAPQRKPKQWRSFCAVHTRRRMRAEAAQPQTAPTYSSRSIDRKRPSYGYRRVTALLNRELSERVNPKGIYRILKRNKLLLERCTGDGRGRKHDGDHHAEAEPALVFG